MIQADPHRSQTTATDDPLAAMAEERETFRRRLPELLGKHDGQFVLIHGRDVLGVFDDRASALREGYRRFGAIPFLVRQVTATELAVYLPNITP